jgi:hypothetical protein
LDVIFKFLVVGLLLAIDAEPQFSLLGAQHDRLPLHAPDHVEGRLRAAAQGHLEGVLADALLDGLAQLVLDLKEAIRRAEPADALVGALVVVMLDPEPDALARLLEVIKLRPPEELSPDRVPKPLHLAEGHRVVRPRADVRHPVLGHLVLETARPTPGGILAPVVGEHLLGHTKLPGRPPIDLNDRLRRLAAEQVNADDEPRVVVEEGDEVGIAATQPEAEDVALPHLVGRRPLKEPWLARVALGPPHHRLDELLLVQGSPYRLRTRLHEEPAPQHLGDPFDPPALVGLLEGHNLLAHRLREPRRPCFAAAPGRRRSTEQGRFRAPVPPVRQHPAVERVHRDVEQPSHLRLGPPFLDAHLYSPKPKLRRVGSHLLSLLATAVRAPRQSLLFGLDIGRFICLFHGVPFQGVTPNRAQ